MWLCLHSHTHSHKHTFSCTHSHTGHTHTHTHTLTQSHSLTHTHSPSLHVHVCLPPFRHGRFKRSNSVTASVQADLELEGFPIMEDKGLQFGGGFQRHSEPSTPTQYGAVRTVRTQGLFSYREDYRTPTEPPSPQRSPEPWMEPPIREAASSLSTGTGTGAGGAQGLAGGAGGDSGRASPSCRRDGSWFMTLLHAETKRMEGWCKEMEAEAEENDLSEESECWRRDVGILQTAAVDGLLLSLGRPLCKVQA